MTRMLFLVGLLSGIGFTQSVPDWKPTKEKPLAELSTRKARTAVATFKKAIRAKDPGARMDALAALVSKGRHPAMTGPILAVLKKDKAPFIRVAAARMLGRVARPSDKLARALWKLGHSKGMRDKKFAEAREAAIAAMEKELAELHRAEGCT